MKWLKSVNFRSKIFWGYLLLFYGIIIVVIGSVGMLWFKKELKNQSELEKRQLYEKAGIIAQDLEEQFVSMRKAALTSTSSREFRRYLLNKNSYYKIDIVEQIEIGSETVNITEECFLISVDKNEMLSSIYGTLPVSLYSSMRFSQDQAQFVEDILWESSNSEKRIVLELVEEDILILFPLSNLYSLEEVQKRGAFGFVISKEDLEKRISKLVGNLNGSLSIRHDDFLIYQNGDSEGVEEAEAVRTVAGDFSLTVIPHKDSTILSSWLGLGFIGNFVLFGMGFVVALGLAILITWPINKIGRQMGIIANGNLWYAWKDIEKELEKILDNSEKYDEKKYHTLRQQTIGMIVSGKYSSQFQSFLLFFNIRTDFMLYGIISCQFVDKEQGMDEKLYILQQIENLEEKNAVLYPCWEEDGNLKILAGVDESGQFQELLEHLKGLFDNFGMDVDMELLKQASDIDTLGENREPVSEPAESQSFDEGNLSKLMISVAQYLEEHCMDYELSLENVAGSLEITPAYLSRIVKKETGITYKEYVTKLKMEKARELLLQEDMTVSKVCEKIGYTNVSYFIKLFKNYTGETPAKWKENYNQNKNAL